MKLLSFAFVLFLSFSAFADEVRPMLDITQINTCAGNQELDLTEDLQGRYGTIGAKKLSQIAFVAIGKNGFTEMSNVVQQDNYGRTYYYNEKDLNRLGYCVSQKLVEKEDSVSVVLDLRRSHHSLWVNSVESNKFIVKLKDGKYTYKEKSFGIARFIILPAGGAGGTKEVGMEKLSH